jgi:hypothetical protein
MLDEVIAVAAMFVALVLIFALISLVSHLSHRLAFYA